MMVTYALLILAAWALLGIIAPTRPGRHARHNAVFITRPAGPLNPDGSVTGFAHVQERGEYRLGKLIGLAAGGVCVAVAWTSGADPIALVIVTFLPMILCDAFSRKVNFIDYAGHGAEIIAAEYAGAIGYRAEEIERMRDDPDKRGQDIAEGLDRARWLARVVFALGRR
jgi:hypothetical protein